MLAGVKPKFFDALLGVAKLETFMPQVPLVYTVCSADLLTAPSDLYSYDVLLDSPHVLVGVLLGTQLQIAEINHRCLQVAFSAIT